MSKVEVHKSPQYVGEKVKYTIDFADLVTEIGANVSSVSWTSLDTTLMTIDSGAVNSNVAEIVATAVATGRVSLECDATFADSATQIHTRYIEVNITTRTA